MIELLGLLLATLASVVRSRRRLLVENLLLWQQQVFELEALVVMKRIDEGSHEEPEKLHHPGHDCRP